MSFDAEKAAMRIGQLVSEDGRSERQISIAATKKADALKDIRRGREPSWSRARALARELNCSPGYLLGSTDSRHDSDDEGGYVRIKQFTNAALSAGPGALVDEEFETGELRFRSEWLHKVTSTSPDRLAVLPVRGESMLPTISDGDVVLVDLGQREIASTKVYALREFDGLKVKRLYRSPEGAIIIKGDNPHELEYDLDGDVEVIGRVIWLGRRV